MSKDDPLEKTIEHRVCEYAKSKGCLAYKFSSPMCLGVCDRIFICNGRVWFIEFKRDGKKPTVAQMRHHLELARQGVAVYVVDNISLGKEIIDYEVQPEGPRHHWSAIRFAGGDQIAR